jgi:hypothetical protein
MLTKNIPFCKHFHKYFRKNLSVLQKYTFSKHCHVLTVLSRLPIWGWIVQSNLSQLSCPCYMVPDVLSKISCPDPSILSRPHVQGVRLQLPCPGHLVQCFPFHDATVMSLQSCQFCPFQAHLSRFTCWAGLSRLSCHVLAVLSSVLSRLTHLG